MRKRTKAVEDVLVVGRACRLPGASSVAQLWENLRGGHLAIRPVPDDRWVKEKYGHPRLREPGRSYVWSAGTIDDIWGFDPAVFGISPREAEQMDPQQRILLELTWEALEDAGLRRSDLAGKPVGVFVGASTTEYQTLRNSDVATADGYSATGGALSIVSNRISHAFDFRGPSFTVDTACSSSLVALSQALSALREGTIDTAVVGGVNSLLSPYGFVLFSQATMLSPDGLCRTFDAKANGYVRAEGGVVLVLRTAEAAARANNPVFGSIVATGVNSDGRTNGIALPSRDSQRALLEEVYLRAKVDPRDLAFVEAHGTGTRVGDPIEASVIGEVLGQRREEPLLVGSIKSNIGHLEAGSGLAGVLKALLALEHDALPPSINFDTPNPDIDFEGLNLAVCRSPTPLPRGLRPRYAGINSFGFGGTNAHVVVSDAPRPKAAKPAPAPRLSSDLFLLSAATEPALRDLARLYAEHLGTMGIEGTREVAAAAAHQRELMGERAIVAWDSPRDLVRKLERFADRDAEVPGLVRGTSVETRAPVAFVFSGNGAQWPGMGRDAYRANRAFRETFDEIDTLFDRNFGWSVTEALFAQDLAERLTFTHVAQPLIFAIQVSVAQALRAEGLEPAFVLGHSVGEIAAATIAGALSLVEAVSVIQARSHRQEMTRDLGRMAVVAAPREQVEALCREIGDVTIAAENSARAFTVAGPTEAIAHLGKIAHARRIVTRQLDLAYPFHCHLVDAVEQPILSDLAALRGAIPTVPMVSTVTGVEVTKPLRAEYWWRNIREPVRFSTALDRAARLGARIFIEIGPRSILGSNIRDVLEGTGLPSTVLGTLERAEPAEGHEPIRHAVLSAVARGADISLERLFGARPARAVPLPHYPWARREFRPAQTAEAIGSTFDANWHALLGAKTSPDALEWTRFLDSEVLPELAEHVVGGQAILPGAAFVEIALEAGRQWAGGEAELHELDIVQPLPVEKDRAREVKVRIAPATGLIEVLSRPRLTRGSWTTHASGRLTKARDEAPGPVEAGSGATIADSATIYGAAQSVGLRYGPAFRLVDSVARTGERSLLVDLVPPTSPAPSADPRWAIDPTRLDACFHGLFALFGELGAARRGTAYIPVRFGQVRLDRPRTALARASIEIVRAGEGSILADFVLLDADGGRIGHLLDARFQAVRVERASTLEERAIVAETVALDAGVAGRPGLGEEAFSRLAAAAAHLSATDDERSTDQLLLEAFASAAGLAAARRLADGDRLTAESVDAMPGARRARMRAAMQALEAEALAVADEDGWSLSAPDALPPPGAILRTIAGDHPERSAELVLAGRLDAWAPEDEGAISSSAMDGYDLGGIARRAAGTTLLSVLDEAGAITAGRGLRILEIGFSPASFALAARARRADARLTILDLDPRRIERAKLALEGGHLSFADSTTALPPGGFDLVVAAEGLHRFMRAGGLLPAIGAALAQDGAILAVEAIPSLFRDLALGGEEGWFDESGHSPLRHAEEWRLALADSGFATAEARPVRTEAEEATLIVASAPIRDPAEAEPPATFAIRSADGGLAARLAARLADRGGAVSTGDLGEAIEPTPDAFVLLMDGIRGKDGVATLREGALALLDVARACPRGKGTIWLVLREDGSDRDPVASGLAAFARTLTNEFAGTAFRRVTVEGPFDEEALATALAGLIRHAQVETEFVLRADGPRVLRFVSLAEASPPGAAPAAAMLERGSAGGLSGLHWRAAEDLPPRDGEVEIAVEATGLNFRDVMWAMSLLPDDILEDGFAGPTLGLECAGTIARVGAGIDDLAPGDRVLAFAPSAFATSVRVPRSVVMPVPAAWKTEAAAGVPVAFLTAYWGLVELARLKAGEWVLIHGAAGGVGLAAIQIAQWRGATIVATAGSPEKRDLLGALGVEHVLDSRSTAFAEDIRRLRHGGVDVVLNSLSGEAMERSIGTLRPFGRFVELGKRDYVANTRIGLRPFKRNLSYFGVDVDQLLNDGERATQIFGELMRLFEAGDLSPLPYRLFGEGETLDAFRLMQQSGHIGKIVVRPDAKAARAEAPSGFAFDPDRTHLVTGGFGGFGIEAARFLADRGARHLALLGRSGAASDEAQALMDELEAKGVRVAAIACDVADEASLAEALATIRSAMPPLAGILHGAMVLEDALAANMTADQMTRVLAPKVAGAENLDRLTAGEALDYFVMFSSITTFIGNPGQGAYVAANGYLEGLAKRRRGRGRPGLALAWGAISDVGILARRGGLAETLAKRVGVVGMPAREALRLMTDALALERAGGPATMAVGTLDWSAARRLPALASPTFGALVRDGGAADPSERASVDLRALIAAGPPEAVRKRVVETIVEEIATVLRVPRQDIGPAKRLGELGLDSLMAIELASALKDRLGLDDPPSGSVAAMTTYGLADQLIAMVGSDQPDADSRVAIALNERHVGGGLDTETAATAIKVVAERAKELKDFTS